jgi:hypothetical protein
VRLGYRVFGEAWLLRAGGHGLARTSAGCRPYSFEVEVLAAGAGSSAKKAF